ncbi:MAG: YbaK/EbsC family protein [Patescibacteria group bacterium]
MQKDEVLKKMGFDFEVKEFPQTTRTAQEAADAIGCSVSQIAKSIIFKGNQTQKPYLVIASGSNRVNEKVIEEKVGEAVEKADADFVRQKTGFVIGCVAPFGHKEPMLTFIDEDLLRFQEIWASAGTPNTVFKLTPRELQKISGGKVINI